MTRRRDIGGLGRLFCFFLLGIAGCAQEAPDPSTWPMRPLVYTENPDLTPEAAAVNEERLSRELVQSRTSRGKQVTPTKLPEIDSPETLGRTIVEALFSRDERLWDHVFVPVQDYAALVHMELAPSQAFVDGLQAKSRNLWDVFEPPSPSEARPGGWRGLFEFVAFDPGDPRRLDGKPASKDEDIAQYWNGKLTMRYVPSELRFELPVLKVLKIQGEPSRYYLGSPIGSDPLLHVLVSSGVHLKPELMRPEEYPYPLQVGSFWRYVRFPEGHEDDVVNPEEMATAVVVEVVSVDRFDTLRLIRLRRSYNDSQLTKTDEWWVASPRRIYICDGGCRRNIENLSWILRYFSSQAPIYTFPLKSGATWGAGGYDNNPTFQVALGEPIDLPGGVFPSTLVLTGQGALGAWDSVIAYPQSRIFVWGKGLIQRRLQTPKGVIIESLSEYRLMPSN